MCPVPFVHKNSLLKRIVLKRIPCAQELLVKKRAHGNTYSFPEGSHASSCTFTTQELNAQMRDFI